MLDTLHIIEKKNINFVYSKQVDYLFKFTNKKRSFHSKIL